MSFSPALGNLLTLYAQQQFPAYSPAPGLPTPAQQSQGVEGTNNAAYGHGQGPHGAPYGNLGALLGGTPQSSQRMTMPTTQTTPEPQQAPTAPVVPGAPTATAPAGMAPQPGTVAAMETQTTPGVPKVAAPSDRRLMTMLAHMAGGAPFEMPGLFAGE